MLSDRCYCALGILVPIYTKFGICKYTWNPYRKILVSLPASNKNAKLVSFNLTLLVSWIFYIICQIIRFYLQDDLNSVVYLVACVMVLFVASISAFLILVLPDDIALAGINAALVFLETIKAKFIPHYDSNNGTYMKLLDLFGLCIILFTTLLAIITSLFVIHFPQAVNLFGNILPINNWYLFPINYLLPIYVSWIFYANFSILLIIIFYICMVFLPLFIMEIKLGRGSKYKSLDILREADNLMLVYRCAELLVARMNQLLGIFLIPAQTVCTLLFDFSSYVLIRHRKEMSIVPFLLMITWMGLASVVWSLMLAAGGWFHSYMNKILRSWRKNEWKSPNEHRVMRRFIRSCKPMAIGYGKVFVVRRKSLLVYLRGLTRGLKRALLTITK